MASINTASITSSVGLNGVNRYEDTWTVQELLNQNRHLSDHPEIAVDGIIGPKTIGAIKVFQSKVAHMSKPDGRVDPNGMTLLALNQGATPGEQPVQPAPKPDEKPDSGTQPQISLLFPLKRRPSLSYKKGARYFGANRANGRLHAGCDLIASPGTEIYAVADGKILSTYYFYMGTNAVEVEHSGGFVVRYGEISKLADGLKVGSTVKRGQLIAYIGQLSSGSSMLHFELYTGAKTGALTVRANKPYQRRSDVIDPAPYLDTASMN